ncbi:hypothetical protein FACS189421_06940 [Bacteroidia bacterium]|nr:hypothetical protein FACS189421_06940 [Bacteroidia bacterium]
MKKLSFLFSFIFAVAASGAAWAEDSKIGSAQNTYDFQSRNPENLNIQTGGARPFNMMQHNYAWEDGGRAMAARDATNVAQNPKTAQDAKDIESMVRAAAIQNLYGQSIDAGNADLAGAGSFEYCAQKVFAAALAANQNMVRENDEDYVIQGWVYRVFQDKSVLEKIMQCPDADTGTGTAQINIPPIAFVFPGGRQIIVNYSTQLKILRQREMLAGKRTLTKPSERVDPNGEDVWTNTQPAWYAIMVVQAGALDEYVGADGNDTISPRYMLENPDKFLPKNNPLVGAGCTSYSSLANDNDIINISAHKTIGEKSSAFSGNDYYVSGAKNLQWITWTEVALDVALTVGTAGAGTAISAFAKTLRIGRTAKKITQSMRVLEGMEDVAKFRRLTAEAEKAATLVKDAEKLLDSTKATLAAQKTVPIGGKEITMTREWLDEAARLLKNNPTTATDKLVGRYKLTADEINHIKRIGDRGLQSLNSKFISAEGQIANRAAELAKAQGRAGQIGADLKAASESENVSKLTKAEQELRDLEFLRDNLKAFMTLKRGNVVARTVESGRGFTSIRDLSKITDYQSAVRNLERARAAGRMDDVAKYSRQVEQLENLDDVRKYKAATTEARAVKTAVKTILTANKQIDKIAASAGKAGTRAGRIRDFLFRSTNSERGRAALEYRKDAAFHTGAKAVDATGKVITGSAIVHGAEQFILNMYDYSVVDNGKFTSNIDFNAFGLLSADDLDGQENEFSHGMFLMWRGDSISPADDDAAFLLAMDFASKFHEDIMNTQDDLGAGGRAATDMCNVDIYVVRPIIKNPGTDDSLYYLIMNDTPWRVRAPRVSDDATALSDIDADVSDWLDNAGDPTDWTMESLTDAKSVYKDYCGTQTKSSTQPCQTLAALISSVQTSLKALGRL